MDRDTDMDSSSNNSLNLNYYHHQPAAAAPGQSFQILPSSLSLSSSDDLGYYSSNYYYNMEAAGKRQVFLRSYQFSRRKASLMERIKNSSFIRAVKRLIRSLMLKLRSRSRSRSTNSSSTWKITRRLHCKFTLIRSSSSSYCTTVTAAAAAAARTRFHRLVVVSEIN